MFSCLEQSGVVGLGFGHVSWSALSRASLTQQPFSNVASSTTSLHHSSALHRVRWRPRSADIFSCIVLIASQALPRSFAAAVVSDGRVSRFTLVARPQCSTTPSLHRFSWILFQNGFAWTWSRRADISEVLGRSLLHRKPHISSSTHSDGSWLFGEKILRRTGRMFDFEHHAWKIFGSLGFRSPRLLRPFNI